ncbi:MAG: tyrosine-type recombinase/integrase [Betaproteobacteria bacterium]|nr:tyrosine-type recombinase/integrase [Betaproteobacteria bacterium]
MAINLLSDAQCRNATCEGRKIRKLSDGGGLYLWVLDDGSKYWRLRYWLAGKEKSLSLGVYPSVGLKDARSKRDEQRKVLGNSLDPSAERKAAKLKSQVAAANSFEKVANEWYAKQAHTWVPHHAADVLRRLEGNIYPSLGRRPIADIEAPELLAALRKIEGRGAYDLAHRVLQVCGQVFRYAIATGRCKHDLSADLRGALTPHKKLHQAAVRPEELPDLLRAIATYDEVGSKQTRLALQLLAQTFVRTNELIGAEWAEFKLDNALWVIPAGRMKMKTEHIVPLSKQALSMLAELKEIACGSRYVFPGRNPEKPISNNTMLFALYRLGYKGKMTGHGFRAVASTILNETGFNPDVIERQLAHCERNEIRGAYNRAEYIKERARMMQHWADYLDGLVKGAQVLLLHGNAA